MSEEANKPGEFYLLVDGEPYCQVLEVEIDNPLFGRSQQRLILDKPIHLDLLDPRKFGIKLSGGQVLAFDPHESGADGLSLVGCPGASQG